MRFRKLSEVARLCALALAAGWLLHPFATGRAYGGGDAIWYAHMLADFVAQVRAGVFPVFAGQTDLAFNGAVYPLRVAPLYQHLGGLLDLLTLHSLGVFGLQHLVVIVSGAAGIVGSYLTLCWMAPTRRWSAAGFAILYLSCPGVLATIYTQDLYMTWMTVGLAPFAVYGIVRTFRHDDLRSQVVLGSSLAALWWAHSPIALWFTAIAAATQVFRFLFGRSSAGALGRPFLGALVFILLALYPFISVALIGSPGEHSAAAAPLTHSGLIVDNVRQAFPASLHRLGETGGLGDLQLGYGLWAVLLAVVVVWAKSPNNELATLLAAFLLLYLLLIPIPGVNRFLWMSLPGEVLRITYYWPMQRFYLILAALLVAAGQVAWDSWAARTVQPWLPRALLLAACCGWSLTQGAHFILSAKASTSTSEETNRGLRPENSLLMDHAYGLFAGLPSHFSNGVVDPRSEARLLPAPTNAVAGRMVASGSLTGAVDANPGILDLYPGLRLEPGQRYRLDVAFAHPEVPGTLQCVGRTFFREYLLPSSGEARSFGSGPTNSHDVDLWSTDPTGDTITLRFIPSQPGTSPGSLAAFGAFQLRERIASEEPVEVTSLLPFSARVKTPTPAILETPRMFMPGYDAWVDGSSVEVVKTADLLVGVPISAGAHTALVRYSGPILLRISYWGSLLAWAAALCALAFRRGPLRN